MPLLTCDCGAQHDLTDTFLREMAGKVFTCSTCGVSRKLPPIKRNAPAANPIASLELAVQADLLWSQKQKANRGSYRAAIIVVVGLVICILVAGALILRDALNRNPHGDDAAADENAGKQAGKDVLVGGVANPAALRNVKSAVQKYLAENLNDPQYEEVKWWPAMQSDVLRNLRLEPYRFAVERCEDQIDNAERLIENAKLARERAIAAKEQIIRDGGFRPGGPGKRGGAIVIADTDNGTYLRRMEQYELEREEYIKRQEDFMRESEKQLEEKQLELTEAEKISAPLICRIKYRSKNVFGASILFDQVFEIVDGNAEPVDVKAQAACLAGFRD